MAKLIMTVAEMQDRNNWLQARNAGIGGSDAAAVIGLNKWKSPFQLWMEKTGQVEVEDLSKNEYIYWGNVLEEAVANRFCELTGKKVQRRGLLQDEEYPFLLASVDRMVVGENAGLECKTCNGFAAKQWEDDEVPTQYYIQCQHYMMVTGCETWYIACLIGGNHFVWKEIPRCEEDIKALREAEMKFWGMVESHTMPEVDGSASAGTVLSGLYQGGQTEPVELPKEAADILEAYDTFKTSEESCKLQAEECKNKLKQLMGDNEVGIAGERKVTWKTQNGRTILDSKRLKADKPEIYKEYSKVGNPIRVFKVG